MTAIPDLTALDVLRREPAFRERGLQLDDVLGAGGMAVVYRARDTRHDRDVAIKVLRVDLGAESAEARFAQEIRVAAGLRHPNVLPLFDSGTLSDGRLFSVMPVAEGRPLSALIKEGPLAIADAVRLARETAEALAYLHQRGYVHRDVKPENILVEAGHAVLTDFGLAASTLSAPNALTPRVPAAPARVERIPSIESPAPATPDDPRLTRAGTTLGTLPYMSPEALLGDSALDPRTDIYALGIVLYEALTGRLPFEARTPTELLARRTREAWPSARAARPDVPETLDSIIARATALDAGARYSSAEELASSLAGLGPTGESRLIPGPRRFRRVAALTIASLAVFGTVAWFVVQQATRLDLHRVVVADLVNDSGETESVNIGSLAGDIITQAVTAATSFEVVNADMALPSRLQRATPVADSTLSRQTRALVNETRSGLVVTGAYFRSGATREFVAQVIDARSGRVLGVAGPMRATTQDPDPALHALADSVVAILRLQQRSLE